MANNDFTRPRFDLSPWRDKDPLTIREATCLWYELTPDMTDELIKLFPVEWSNRQRRFVHMVQTAEAGRLPIHGAVKTKTEPIRRVARSQYLTRNHSAPDGRVLNVQQGQEVENWGATEITLADLRAYAESIGERPAFFFSERAADLTGNSPGAGLGASELEDGEQKGKWADGIQCVAYDAAKGIVAKGNKLTGGGLEKAIAESPKVEFKNNEYHLKTTDASLNDRQTKVKQKTIFGWATELKMLLKQ